MTCISSSFGDSVVTPSNLPAQSAEPQCLDSGNWASFLSAVPILQTTVMNLLPYRSGWAWLLLIGLPVEAQVVPFHCDPATCLGARPDSACLPRSLKVLMQQKYPQLAYQLFLEIPTG